MSRLVDGGGDDLRLQVAKARLLLAIGKLRLKLDDLFEAQNKLDSAGALYEQLLAQQPDHAETRLGMAETLQTIARLEYERGYADEAIAHCEQARDLIAEAAPGPQAGVLRASIEEDLKRYRR